MSESHQPSIKTFFQAPKCPRHVIESNSDSDNWEDRPLSKSTRLDSLKQQEDESKDSDDLYEPIGVGNRVEHTSSNDQGWQSVGSIRFPDPRPTEISRTWSCSDLDIHFNGLIRIESSLQLLKYRSYSSVLYVYPEKVGRSIE